jgi:hypothetical protein
VLRDGHAEVASGNRLKAVRPAEARAQACRCPRIDFAAHGREGPQRALPFPLPGPRRTGCLGWRRALSGQGGAGKRHWEAGARTATTNRPTWRRLYRKYHKAGLEIVALNFEEEEQLKDPARLRAFLRQYGIEYTVLLGGTPAEVNAKLPQAVNLNSWPTTFFLDRNGLVRKVHVGFAAPASGELNALLKEEFTGEIEGLLSQKAASVVARDQRAAR